MRFEFFFLPFFFRNRKKSWNKKRNESADLNEYPRYDYSINYSKADFETLIRFVQLEPATVILGETDRDGRSIRPRTVCSTVDVNRQ